MRNTLRVIFLFVAGCLALTAFAPLALAQGPIRVESHQVLVPSVVFDKKLYDLTGKKYHKHSLSYLIAHDPHFWDTIAVRGLAAKDFNLLEDGQRQEVLSVAFEAPAFSIVADNLGKHPELVGSGGGVWTYPDLDKADQSLWLPWPQYVIGYVPPPSAPGSCHKIQLDVTNPHLAIWSRSEFCNTQHPASDPLSGTDFGKRMEADLISAQEGEIDLKLHAFARYGDAVTSRVNIQIEFPSASLKHEFKDGTLYATIGAAGAIYRKDGSVAARFSDFACCDYGNSAKPSSTSHSSANLSDHENSMLPHGYQTQIDLPPGDYDVRVVLSDGKKFGRKQIPLTVKARDEKEPAISEVAVCRRIRKVPAESAEAPAKSPGSYIPLVIRGVEYTPAPEAHFTQKDMLFAYFEIYDSRFDAKRETSPAGQVATKIKAHMMVVDAETGDIKMDFLPVDAGPYAKPGSSLAAVARGVTLSTLPEGAYRLEVQASDSTGKITAWHTANFFVDDNTLKPLEELQTTCSIRLQC
jgi:hypothetical protein